MFSYAHVPWVKPAQKILEQKILPTAEVKLQLLKNVIERLTENNRYVYIGMDHFARPDDELTVAQRNKTLQRNFQGYSTRGQSDIYSFGMSAISQIPDAYWQNEKELPSYFAALDAGRAPLTRGYLLTDEDKIRRETIMRVMCDPLARLRRHVAKARRQLRGTFCGRTRGVEIICRRRIDLFLAGWF